MSCALKETALIENLNEVFRCLYPHSSSSESGYAKGVIRSNQNNDNCTSGMYENWLEECIVSISPTMDLMVISHIKRVVILKSQYEKVGHGEKCYKFSVTWNRTLEHWQMGDEVTSILCLPIVSQKQSSIGVPDWTAVVVGFKSGYISFYTEGGLLLLSQLFHEDAVTDISVRTYVEKNFGSGPYSDLTEELTVLYSKCVVSVDGFGLLQTLKVCRNKVAKASALGEEIAEMATLGYKKWSLSQQEKVYGCVASGMLPPHLYDHVILTSQLNGFNQTIPGVVPTTSHLLTVGRMPYFASYSIKDGATPLFITDVAIHYASKIKESILSTASGWLFGNKAEASTKNERPPIEQPITVPFRYTLPDKRRVGLSIRLSKSRRLAAITDDFGRVNILDVHKSYIMRMFKGYRDSECGWINVAGEVGGVKREVHYLIIHAPRRSLLEVWLPQHGPRIAAFNVPKKSKLIYVPHTVLGANTQQGSTCKTTHVFLLNAQGSLECISIPFHLALSGKTSKQARDMHLLKSLKSTLRTKDVSEIMTIIREIKTSAVKCQLLQILCNSNYISVELLKTVLEELGSAPTMSTDEDDDELTQRMDHDSRNLSQQLSRLSQLLQVYTLLSSFHSQTGDDSSNQYLPSSKMSQSEVHILLAVMSSIQKRNSKSVKFSEQFKYSLSSFLQAFDFSGAFSDKVHKLHFSISLRHNLGKEMEFSLAQFFFGWHFASKNFLPFAEVLKTSGIDPEELLRLSYSYWQLDDVITPGTIHGTLCLWLILAVFCNSNIVSMELGETRPLWVNVREELISWPSSLHSYIAALNCREIESIFLDYINNQSQSKMEEDSTENSGMDPVGLLEELLPLVNDLDKAPPPEPKDHWEELSLEIIEWNLIIKNLEKLVVAEQFYSILTRRPNVRKAYPTSEFSIKAFHQKGKGYLSELIAQWLIESNLDNDVVIQIIMEEKDLDTDNSDDITDEDEPKLNVPDQTEDKSHDSTEPDELEDLKKLMLNVRDRFPESTKHDILLVNLCWEWATLWKKNPNQIGFYEYAVKALKRIRNSFLLHGVCYMLWETWVVHFVQNLTTVIDKVSRRPRERISLRNIGLSECHLEKFLFVTKDLLQTLMSARSACEVDRAPLLLKDDLWKEIDSVPSLVEVILGQKMTSVDLTFLHQILLIVLNLIVKYELRNVKPSLLFPERDRAALFKPLISSWRLTSDEGAEAVNHNQLAFLNKVVSAAVIGLPDSHASTVIETPSGFYDAIEIGRSWGVSLDAIKRHYVCELYSSGLDTVAEQALTLVYDSVLLASQMMVIAGQRLHYLISSSLKSIEITALITPNVKEWCSSLDHSCLRSPDVPINQTLKMVSKALLLIPETNQEYKVATNLLRALRMIHESHILDER